MKTWVISVSTVALSGLAANAGGLDRSGQSVMSLFSEDNIATITTGVITPSITGSDDQGNRYDVGSTYTQFGMSYTREISDKFAFAFIYDQPFGAKISYENNPTLSTLGGTTADLSSGAVSLLGKYRFNDRISTFGGMRLQRIDADVALNGTAYANAISIAAVANAAGVDKNILGAALQDNPQAIVALGGSDAVSALGTSVATQVATFQGNAGYNFSMENDYALGYTVGAAYEIPDIAFRLAATYHSEIDHSADVIESVFGSDFAGAVDYVTPQSINIDFQTGIASDTLLTASYRWTDFSAVDLTPAALGNDLVDLDDSHRYTIGLGRRFSENFAGSVKLIYERKKNSATVTPLGPTDGQLGISLAGEYTYDDVTLSGGLNYTMVGDANAGVADQSKARFTSNSVFGAGLRIAYNF